jgi:hypothetical protein
MASAPEMVANAHPVARRKRDHRFNGEAVPQAPLIGAYPGHRTHKLNTHEPAICAPDAITRWSAGCPAHVRATSMSIRSRPGVQSHP